MIVHSGSHPKVPCNPDLMSFAHGRIPVNPGEFHVVSVSASLLVDKIREEADSLVETSEGSTPTEGGTMHGSSRDPRLNNSWERFACEVH